MQVAAYRDASGNVKYVEWVDGRFTVDGYEFPLDQVLAWDAAGSLGWASPEMRSWAHSLARPAAAAPAVASAPAAAPAAAAPGVGTRDALLADIISTMAEYPGYTTQHVTGTDLRIDNQVALASWGSGKKKVEFSAQMKAVEAERVLYYFEILKEQGSGMSFGGFESESYSTFGGKRFGKTKEVVIGPNGVEMNYDWDYAQTRKIIESVCARHGWRLKTVLTPGKTKY